MKTSNNFVAKSHNLFAASGAAFLSLTARSLLLACVLTPLAAKAGDTLQKVRDTQTITIAYRQAPPFSFTSDNKQIVGYSIDVCLKVIDAVKRELKMPNIKVEYLPVDLTTRFSTIIEGKADLECGSTTDNVDRRKRVAFTLSHFFSSVRMIVKKNSGINNWPDLKNRTIAIPKSTTTIDLINARNNVRLLNLKVIETQSDPESFSFVEQGKADVYAMDDVLLYSLRAAAKNPEEFVVVGDQLSVEPYSIMFRRDDKPFKKVVDHAMAQIMEDGELQKLYNHWFLEPNGPKGINMNMPMSFLLRDSLRFPSDKSSE